MLVRLCVLLRVMALEIELMTNRGLTPVRPSSGASARRRIASFSAKPSTALARVEAQLLRQVQALALGLGESREDREHRSELEHVRVEVHVAERRRARDQLLVDARFVAEGERIGHLDDDHAVEQRLVLLLLQELVELGEVGVREDGLVEVDQREARHLDVLLLRHGQQEIEELALDLEDLDHLQHAAARGVDGARTSDQARGSPSSPISATFARSTEPTRSAMSAVVGSCGA